MNKIVLKNKKHNSPLRYPGGKSCLAQYFRDLIYNNNINNCTYIEPFAGGSGAAIQLLFMEEVDRIMINDFDRSIYAFWWSILKKTEEFTEKIRSISLNMTEWNNQKNIFLNKSSKLFERGFATFYLNRTNRSGILKGGPIGGKDQSGKWKIDARFNRETLINRVKTISLYSKRIKLANIDGIELLQKKYNEKNIFVYFDPPYFQKGGQLYLNHYKYSDHKKLADFLNGHPNFNWVLTYDNVKEISDLYKNRRSQQFNIHYSSNKASTGNELMIFSDRLAL